MEKCIRRITTGLFVLTFTMALGTSPALAQSEFRGNREELRGRETLRGANFHRREVPVVVRPATFIRHEEPYRRVLAAPVVVVPVVQPLVTPIAAPIFVGTERRHHRFEHGGFHRGFHASETAVSAPVPANADNLAYAPAPAPVQTPAATYNPSYGFGANPFAGQ